MATLYLLQHTKTISDFILYQEELTHSKELSAYKGNKSTL